MKKTIFLLFLFVGFSSQAQDSTTSLKGLITKKTFGPFRLNDQKITIKELKAELYKIPAAIPVYKKSKTSEIIGITLLLPIIVYAISDNNSNKATAYEVAAVASGGVSLFFLFRSHKLRQKAIEIHNEKYRVIY